MSITSAVLKVCHAKVSDAVIVAQNEALNLSPALYPYWKSNFKTISIPSGMSTVTSDDIFHGEVPSTLVLAMVKTQAFSGDNRLNPFNFVHSNVNRIELSVDGQSIPGQPLKPNFETGELVPVYILQQLSSPRRGQLDFSQRIRQWLFALLFRHSRRGYTKLVMNFASPTPNLMLILYSSFPSLIKIDKTGAGNLHATGSRNFSLLQRGAAKRLTSFETRATEPFYRQPRHQRQRWKPLDSGLSRRRGRPCGILRSTGERTGRRFQKLFDSAE